MKIAVTGPKGKLGSCLVQMGCEPIYGDIANLQMIREEIQSVEPDVIINCAAKSTPIDWCEDPENFKLAIRSNTRGVSVLRDVFNGYLIHMSTPYIFDGKRGPYDETYKHYGPLQNYGYSKFGGEVALHTFNKMTTIVRTVGLYGIGDDFVTQCIGTIESENVFYAAKDLYFNPTYIPHLSEALLDLANRFMEVKGGILNLASSDSSMSRYEFALCVASAFDLDKDLIEPVSYKKLNWIAPRPAKSGLKLNLAYRLGYKIYSAIEGLVAYKKVMNV